MIRGGQLKKVPVAGGDFNTRGAATVLCDNVDAYGGSWGESGQIIVAGPSGLVRVSESGGPCQLITKADPKEGDHRWPQVLPGGKNVLFSIGVQGAFDGARIAILDLRTGTYRIVLDGGANARYVPSGHLVFVRGGEMFAVPFDLNRLQVNGVPKVVVDAVFHNTAGGFAAYTVADTGVLLYATPSIPEFEWRDRRGTTQRVRLAREANQYFRISPDGKRVVFQEGGRGDISILTLEDGVTERITSEGTNQTPIWSSDGRAVTFGRLGKGIFRLRLDGGRPPEPLLETAIEMAPRDWTRDGKTLVYSIGDPLEIWTLTLPDDGGPAQPRQLLAGSNVSYSTPVFSPDGRWLAYVSTESGAPQVSVRPFPGPGNKVIVSKEGGGLPCWSPDGRELFYLAPSNQSVMVVDVHTTSGFSASLPRVLIPSAGPFDVDPSGQRFLVLTQARPDRLHVVTNWFEELRQKVPQG